MAKPAITGVRKPQDAPQFDRNRPQSGPQYLEWEEVGSFEKPTLQNNTHPLNATERLLLKLQKRQPWQWVGSVSAPAGKVVAAVVAAGLALSLIGYALYRIALAVREAALYAWAALIESGVFVYMGIGLLFVLCVYAVIAVRKSMKSAVPFEDARRPTHTTTTNARGAGVHIEHHYHINQK